MKFFNKAIIPLLVALVGLGVVVFMLPFGVKAGQEAPNLAELPLNPQVLAGTDIKLSNGANTNVPEIATASNAPSAAVVYVQNNQVFLRWAQTKWTPPKALDSTSGGTPKIAFLPGTINTVHIVWSGYGSVSLPGNPVLPQKVIRHIRCRMMTEPTVTCDQYHAIASTSSSTTNLQLPDIAITSDGRLHVVWFENASGVSKLRTVRSTNSDDGTTWGTPTDISLNGGADGGQPALATDGTFLHLAYRDRLAGVWKIHYRRSNNSASHSWGQIPVPNWDENQVSQHSMVSNPTIAAGGGNVYLAWDIQQSNVSSPTLYGLIAVTNTNSGLNNAWTATTDVTSTVQVSPGQAPTDRLSQSAAAVPATESTLRPSLAVSTTNEGVIVWQERPDDLCQSSGIVAESVGNGTSEIYFADSQADGWSTKVDTLADNSAEYSIDPDIAIDTLGRRNIVFMKATIASGDPCQDGGDQTAYAIYYRGPFTEKWPENGIFLPIIIKNKTS